MARSFAFGSLVAVALFAARVAAQPVSNATCVDQLWSTNSRQQSPCLVSAYLSAQCTNDNTWSVPEIGTEGPYSPPKGDYANLCRCNSVQWNLLSACSMCQGGPAGTWTEWISNCTQSVVNIGTYPLPVPAGVSIPHWAYYDFTTTGVFNAVTASQQSGPESVAVSSATSTATPIGTVTGTVTAPIIETPTGTSSNSTSKSSSNTGAIVGGVVGGILGIALIAVIGFVLMRKGKQNKPDNSANQYANQYAQGGYNPGGAQPPSAAPMMTQYQPGVQHPGMMSPAPGSEYKPYDPSDPSTFPGHNNPNAPSVYPESLAYTQNSQPRPGAYNYAPEV